MKVARTRQQIIDVALDLFIEQGYEETTMEQIAARTEIGATTLYRYFPSKDLLILDPFTASLGFGALLRARPADEPIERALGAVVHGAMRGFGVDDDRFVALRRIVDAAPSPRAKLWDLVSQSRSDLAEALAGRLRLDVDDLSVVFTVGIVFLAYETAGERWWNGDHRRSRDAIIDEVLEALTAGRFILPAMPATPSSEASRAIGALESNR